MMFGFLTSDDNAQGWVFFSAAPWQCSSRLMVVETADHDSSSKRKGREKKSVSRLDREKDESSDWERESISMVTTVMFFFFSLPFPTPIFTRLISSIFCSLFSCLCPSLLHHQSSDMFFGVFFCLLTEASQFLCRI